MEKAVRQNNNAIKGSVADLQRQIRALEQVRDNTAKTTKQFFAQDKQIQQLRNRTFKRGKTIANYELKLLSHMFNISIDVWRYVEVNPVAHIKKFKTSKGRYAPLYFA